MEVKAVYCLRLNKNIYYKGERTAFKWHMVCVIVACVGK